MNKIFSFFATLIVGVFAFQTAYCASVNLSDTANANIRKYVQNMWGVVSDDEAKCVDFDIPDTTMLGPVVRKSGAGYVSILALLAVDVSEHGAEFCASQLSSVGTAGVMAGFQEVVWFLPKDNKELCFWVCDAGYGGERCSDRNSTFVDDVVLKRSAFSDLQVAEVFTDEGNFVETNAIYWPYGSFNCNEVVKSAHYGLWGVVDFTSDGHGVITAPLVVRSSYPSSGRNIENLFNAKLAVADFENKRKVMCASGYVADGDNCVLASEANGDNGGSSGGTEVGPCTGWESLPGSKSSYKKYYISEKKCYEYRCLDGSEGFRSSADRACISCYGTSRGVNSNGVCITCPDNMVFDITQDKCRSGVGYTKQDLLYGRNKTVTSTDLSNQCWTKTIPSEYEQCVVDKTISTGTLKTDFAVDTLEVVGVVDSGLKPISVGGSGNTDTDDDTSGESGGLPSLDGKGVPGSTSGLNMPKN